MSPVPQGEDNRDKPPDHPEDQLNHQDLPDVVINADDSSDSEGEEGYGGYMGYQMLAQDIHDDNNDNDDSGSEEDDDSNNENMNQNASGNAQAEPVQFDENLVQHVTHPDFPDTPNLPGYMRVPDMPRPEKRDLLWNQPRHCNAVMEQGQADKIRSVMSGFQLPASHIPDWAKCLSENQWQEQVVDRLVGKNSCDNQTQGTENTGSSLQLESNNSQTEAGTSGSKSRNSEENVGEKTSSKCESVMDTSKS